jgi:hypothetical protein
MGLWLDGKKDGSGMDLWLNRKKRWFMDGSMAE